MERIPRGIYTQEFREQAIRLVEEDGLPIKEAARRLSLPVGSLKNWLYAAREGKLKEVGKGQKPLTDMEMELARVKKELAEVKLERDLLKKCAAYFAKESR
jgi:transposase